MVDEDSSESLDVFKLRQQHDLSQAKVSRSHSAPPIPGVQSSAPVSSSPVPSTTGDPDDPLPEDEGKDDETIDKEIDDRRIAMRDAFRKLLGQKLGSIYVTNHQERKPRPQLPYYVRVNHNVIDYREVEEGRKKRYTYNFNNGECKLDGAILKRYQVKRYFKKLDKVSSDITDKVALVYEEPKKAGQ
ncbi:MAG: hypothetical protein VW378_05860 [bacterium]